MPAARSRQLDVEPAAHNGAVPVRVLEGAEAADDLNVKPLRLLTRVLRPAGWHRVELLGQLRSFEERRHVARVRCSDQKPERLGELTPRQAEIGHGRPIRRDDLAQRLSLAEEAAFRPGTWTHPPFEFPDRDCHAEDDTAGS